MSKQRYTPVNLTAEELEEANRLAKIGQSTPEGRAMIAELDRREKERARRRETLRWAFQTAILAAALALSAISLLLAGKRG